MKKLIYVATAAFACCALTANAQVQILSAQPTLAPRLVSDPNPLVELEPLPLAPIGQQGSASPFDYFDEETGQQPKVPAPLSSQGNSFADEQTPANDPRSLPVAKTRRSMVDTIVDQGLLASVANASMTPVYWGGAPHTPAPVAQWLMREECVEGLWANYPQQRAAECARMWSHIAGHSCCKGACGAKSPCSICAQPVRNRYTESCAPAATNCDCGPMSCAGSSDRTQCAQASQPAAPVKIASLPINNVH